MAVTRRIGKPDTLECVEMDHQLDEDETISSFFLTALGRHDGLAMYATVATWVATAVYGGLRNGDVFLLTIPFIFSHLAVLTYAVSSSVSRSGWGGALCIVLMNSMLWRHYPL